MTLQAIITRVTGTGIDIAWIPGEKMCTDSNKLEKSKQSLLLVTPNDPQSRLNILAKQLSLGTEMQTERKLCLPLPYVAILFFSYTFTNILSKLKSSWYNFKSFHILI